MANNSVTADVASKKNPPLIQYQHLLDNKIIQQDSNQLTAVKELDLLYWQLQKNNIFYPRKITPQSLFLWGKVGIGKTFLMDLFYQSLPQKNKLRLHFNEFMALIHQQLHSYSGHPNPLAKVAKKLYKNTKVLCLDELFITDIGDGMIIYRLLEVLFKQGLILVTTSNFPIDGLYKDDLQPHIFDPAVALLQQHTKQVHLHSVIDYRLQQRKPKQTYFVTNKQRFLELFQQLNSNKSFSTSAINICGRAIAVERSNAQLVWFDFAALCCGPRSQLDYLEIVNCFNCILISGIPVLGGKPKDQIKAQGTEDSSPSINSAGERKVFYALEDNEARRFISLVDVLYDKGTHLYLSAAVPLESLYCGETLTFEFKRTQSRLIEMQSEDYLNSQGV